MAFLIVGGTRVLACYGLPSEACALPCGMNDRCPSSMTCAPDHYCHASGDSTSCTTAVQPSEAGGSEDGALTPHEDGAPDAGQCVDGPNRFCDDFDGENPGSRWSSRVEDRGAVTFEDVGASPPRALSATVSAGTRSGAAALSKDFVPAPRAIRCAFDMKLVQVTPVGQLRLLDVITTTTGEPYSLSLASTNRFWSLTEYQGPDRNPQVQQEQPLAAAPPLGLWAHVVLDVNESVATLTFADNLVATLRNLRPPSGTKRSIAIGVTFAGVAQEKASVLVDNVDCATAD